jgi:PBP1b-binding outer membrane lipoprotein LpoB
MKQSRLLISICAAALILSGCSSLKRMTGQIDDTVLPGERETILSPEQTASPKLEPQSASDDAVASEEPAAVDEPIVPDCDPTKDANCEAPADGGGVFSDG